MSAESRGELLLVDDDEDVARVFERAFVQAGWVVRRARDGADAMVLVPTVSFTAAVVDIILPRTGGLEVVRALRQQHPLCRIIVVTGVTDKAMERLAKTAGADAFFLKPVELSALLDAAL